MKMDEQELAIWNSAYAKVFVAEYRRLQDEVGSERAEELATAEEPIAAANLAVKCLRAWRQAYDPVDGADSGRVVR